MDRFSEKDYNIAIFVVGWSIFIVGGLTFLGLYKLITYLF